MFNYGFYIHDVSTHVTAECKIVALESTAECKPSIYLFRHCTKQKPHSLWF